MSVTPSLTPDRNYPALFLALDDVLEALGDGRPDDDALRRSFEDSADGFGAEKALLLLVEAKAKPRLKALASRGLSWLEVNACENGLSVPGVSSSCIREALERGVPVMVQDPQGLMGDKVSEVLKLQPCSVLCAPILDPRSGDVLAVLYVQNAGVRNAFAEIDRAWIEVYARALGRAMSGRR
jgi:GAF domain-containing protein